MWNRVGQVWGQNLPDEREGPGEFSGLLLPLWGRAPGALRSWDGRRECNLSQREKGTRQTVSSGLRGGAAGPAGGWGQRLSGGTSPRPRPGNRTLPTGRRGQPLEMGRAEERMDGSPGFMNGKQIIPERAMGVLGVPWLRHW